MKQTCLLSLLEILASLPLAVDELNKQTKISKDTGDPKDSVNHIDLCPSLVSAAVIRHLRKSKLKSKGFIS